MYAPRLRSVSVRDERNFLRLNSYPLCYGWKKLKLQNGHLILLSLT